MTLMQYYQYRRSIGIRQVNRVLTCGVGVWKVICEPEGSRLHPLPVGGGGASGVPVRRGGRGGGCHACGARCRCVLRRALRGRHRRAPVVEWARRRCVPQLGQPGPILPSSPEQHVVRRRTSHEARGPWAKRVRVRLRAGVRCPASSITGARCFCHESRRIHDGTVGSGHRHSSALGFSRTNAASAATSRGASDGGRGWRARLWLGRGWRPHAHAGAHDAFRDHPHVVAQPLGHDIEMPARLFGPQLNVRFRRGSQVCEIRLRRQCWQNLLDGRDIPTAPSALAR